MLQIEELNIIDYLVYKRDAFINRMSRTEEGVKYLKNAYRLEQTTPDRDNLRKKFGRKEG